MMTISSTSSNENVKDELFKSISADNLSNALSLSTLTPASKLFSVANNKDTNSSSFLSAFQTPGSTFRKGAPTIKEQQRNIDELKKENFGLKMRVCAQEDRLKLLSENSNIDPSVIASLKKENEELLKFKEDILKEVTELNQAIELLSSSHPEIEQLKEELRKANDQIKYHKCPIAESTSIATESESQYRKVIEQLQNEINLEKSQSEYEKKRLNQAIDDLKMKLQTAESDSESLALFVHSYKANEEQEREKLLIELNNEKNKNLTILEQQNKEMTDLKVELSRSLELFKNQSLEIEMQRQTIEELKSKENPPFQDCRTDEDEMLERSFNELQILYRNLKNEYQALVNATNEDRSKFNQTLKESQVEIQRLKNELSKYKEESFDWENRVLTLKQSESRLKEELKNFQEQIIKSKASELDMLLLNEKEKECNNLEKRLSDLQMKNNQCEFEIQSMKSKYEELTVETVRYKEKLEEISAEKHQLREKIFHLETHYKERMSQMTLDHQEALMKAAVEHQETQRKTLQELSSFKNKEFELETKYQTTIDELQLELKNLKDKQYYSTHDHMSLISKASELKALNTELQSSKLLNNELINEINLLKGQIKTEDKLFSLWDDSKSVLEKVLKSSSDSNLKINEIFSFIKSSSNSTYVLELQNSRYQQMDTEWQKQRKILIATFKDEKNVLLERESNLVAEIDSLTTLLKEKEVLLKKRDVFISKAIQRLESFGNKHDLVYKAIFGESGK